MTQVMARCARCGRIAPAQVFLVDEYEYSGYGLTEPEGWWGVDYCGEPCVPGDTGRFHGPYRESKGSLNGALTDVSLNITHLEPQSRGEHAIEHGNATGDWGQAQKTHCPTGHEYSTENTYTHRRKDGRVERHCKICRRATKKRYRDRLAAETEKS